MRVQPDDRLYQVNGVWLGPADVPILREIFQYFYVRYSSYGIGFALFLLVSLVQRQMGIGWGWVSAIAALAVAVALTNLVSTKVTHERPVVAVLGMFVADLTAPRRITRPRGHPPAGHRGSRKGTPRG